MQIDPLRDAANEMAAALTHKKVRSVIVFDFSGPGETITLLGKSLAGDFSADLAKAGGSLRVESNSLIGQALDQERFALQLSADPQFAIILARDLKAAAFVSGQLHVVHGTFSVALSCYRSDSGRGIKGLRVTWPINERMKQVLAANTPLPDSGPGLVGGPAAGKNGYSVPRCLKCPRAAYPHQAMADRTQGIVELMVVIGLDGRVHAIHVEKGLPNGLTMAAVQAVQRWKFEPALGPNGKPVAVREIIEMQFQYF